MICKYFKRNISRLMAVLLCAMLVFSTIPAVSATEQSGDCGDQLTWSLSEGVLTITGSGDMWDFTENTMSPWYEWRGEICSLVLPEKLTHVGALAFYDCYRLNIVNLPDKVESIGEFAFASCEKLQLLDLGGRLQTIGESAFHGCWALSDLRLPKSLNTIGEKAFYDCSSITSLVIPSGVMTLDAASFAYCTSLVWVEIQAQLTILPDWAFFGCSQLNTLILPASVTAMGDSALRDCNNLYTVSYDGDSMTVEELKKSVAQDVPGFTSTGFVTNENPGASATSGNAVENADGSVTEQITTVTGGDHSTVSATTDRTYGNENGDTISSNITVTVENDDGWDEALQGVQSAIDDVNNRVQPGLTSGTTNITVYVKDSDKISGEFIDSLAGKDVKLTVIAKDGSSWIIDFRNLNKQELSGAYDLRYVVEAADAAALELMGAEQGYCLRFAENAEINTEVLIRLPVSMAGQTATLFRKDDEKTLTRFQSVIIDREGYAHLYLGSVEGNTEYYLAINLPDATEQAIIPDTMYDVYPQIDYAEPIQYEITGRTSSWGMNLGQVMGIMAAVMVSVIVIVGVVIFTINKRRIRKGYVPGWDDLDDEE